MNPFQANILQCSITCYIGPGAGFAFVGSLLLMFFAFALAAFSLLMLPFRTVLKLLSQKKRPGCKIRRAVILGFDGMDPERTRKLMADGKLPNLEKLSKNGCFSPLQTTCPPISPVAWASFMTGVNPGKHNIFDFLTRNRETYAPQLSSSETVGQDNRANIRLLRKSKPFWEILGEAGVMSTVLRVPMTYPPEKHKGLLLSGLSAPDLRGTQGSFTIFEENPAKDKYTGGVSVPVTIKNKEALTSISGPEIKGHTVKIPMKIIIQDPAVDMDAGVQDSNSQGLTDDQKRTCTVTLKIGGGGKVMLEKGVYSKWVRLSFRKGFQRISGICRFLLLSTTPGIRLYMTPINIDPERPAMPVSHPSFYSAYLAKLIGPFATLGLAEDTWALNENVIGEQAFVQQVYDIQKERETMMIESLKRTRTGLCACVFDILDRMQHCFYTESDNESADPDSRISLAYIHLDTLVGRITQMCGEKDLFLVMSDHGFARFHTGVNINAWLKKEGYLCVTGENAESDYFGNVDWSKTKAYGVGLTGIYINLKGREAQGIVKESEAETTKKEIITKLLALTDTENNESPVKNVYLSNKTFSGPYSDNAPDIVVGFRRGYRVSWGSATGNSSGPALEENTRKWSGDHCMDRTEVPGTFFSNMKPASDPELIDITDIAPSILSLFGINPPGYIDGKDLNLTLPLRTDTKRPLNNE